MLRLLRLPFQKDGKGRAAGKISAVAQESSIHGAPGLARLIDNAPGVSAGPLTRVTPVCIRPAQNLLAAQAREGES